MQYYQASKKFKILSRYFVKDRFEVTENLVPDFSLDLPVPCQELPYSFTSHLSGCELDSSCECKAGRTELSDLSCCYRNYTKQSCIPEKRLFCEDVSEDEESESELEEEGEEYEEEEEEGEGEYVVIETPEIPFKGLPELDFNYDDYHVNGECDTDVSIDSESDIEEEPEITCSVHENTPFARMREKRFEDPDETLIPPVEPESKKYPLEEHLDEPDCGPCRKRSCCLLNGQRKTYCESNTDDEMDMIEERPMDEDDYVPPENIDETPRVSPAYVHPGFDESDAVGEGVSREDVEFLYVKVDDSKCVYEEGHEGGYCAEDDLYIPTEPLVDFEPVVIKPAKKKRKYVRKKKVGVKKKRRRGRPSKKDKEREALENNCINIDSKPKRKYKKRSKRKTKQTGPKQDECCISGCNNGVTNRLRFSLRVFTEEDFKKEFLEKKWDKVCHYHYFSDLYKYKKSQKLNGVKKTRRPYKRRNRVSRVSKAQRAVLA